MSIDFSCPTCAKSYHVKEELAGKTARCACGKQITIPTPTPELALDLSGLLDEPTPVTSKPPRKVISRKEAQDILEQYRWLLTGNIVFWPLHKALENTRSPLVKILIGGLAGFLVGILGLAINSGNVQQNGFDFGFSIVLVFAGIGAGAASLLVFAETVGKRSKLPRWLILALLLVVIAAAVVGYFAYDGYRKDQARHAKSTFGLIQHVDRQPKYG